MSIKALFIKPFIYHLFKGAGSKKTGIGTLLEGIIAINKCMISLHASPLAQNTETQEHMAILGWGCLG